MKDLSRITLRLPEDLKAWAADRAARMASSLNSEIVRVLREKMDQESRPAA